MAETDPTADFLARERAALGDLAADSDLLGVGAAAPPAPVPDETASRFPALGDDGEFSSAPAVAAAPSEPSGLGFDDSSVYAPAAPQAGAGMAASLFAVDEDADTAARKAAFEDQFPAFNDPELDQAVADAAPTTAPAEPEEPSRSFQFDSGPSMTVAPTNPYDDDDDTGEPEAVRAWRSRQADDIAGRNATAERLKGETISRAEREIDTFYEEYNTKKEKTIAKNKYVSHFLTFSVNVAGWLTPVPTRENEAALLAQRDKDLVEGTTWQRVNKYLGLESDQSKTIAKPPPGANVDNTRMRDIYLSLGKEGEAAPGAAGY